MLLALFPILLQIPSEWFIIDSTLTQIDNELVLYKMQNMHLQNELIAMIQHVQSLENTFEMLMHDRSIVEKQEPQLNHTHDGSYLSVLQQVMLQLSKQMANAVNNTSFFVSSAFDALYDWIHNAQYYGEALTYEIHRNITSVLSRFHPSAIHILNVTTDILEAVFHQLFTSSNDTNCSFADQAQTDSNYY